MSIRIIVDSSADMPQEFVDKYNIIQVPLSVSFGEKTYLDRVDIDANKFYKLLASSDVLPVTSQVTPILFKEAFDKVISNGDEAIVITISSNASGTFQSANIAALDCDEDKISIIDSNGLCLGHSYIAILVCEMVEKGYTREQIVEEIMPYTQNRVEHLFCVDTLEFLVKGGRIKAHQAFIANILNIKPILNVHDGITQPISKVRSRKRIIPFYVDKISKEMDESTPFILVGHSCEPEFADRFVKTLKEQLKIEKPIYISEVGPTIGTHSGPGVLSVFYLKKEGSNE